MINELIVKGTIVRKPKNPEEKEEKKYIEHHVFIRVEDLLALGIEPNVMKKESYRLTFDEKERFLSSHFITPLVLSYNEDFFEGIRNVEIIVQPAQHIYCYRRYFDNDRKKPVQQEKTSEESVA